MTDLPASIAAARAAARRSAALQLAEQPRPAARPASRYAAPRPVTGYSRLPPGGRSRPSIDRLEADAATLQGQAYAPPRNQIAEAGMMAAETTGLPGALRANQALRAGDYRGFAGEAVMGGLNLLGTMAAVRPAGPVRPAMSLRGYHGTTHPHFTDYAIRPVGSGTHIRGGDAVFHGATPEGAIFGSSPMYASGQPPTGAFVRVDRIEPRNPLVVDAEGANFDQVPTRNLPGWRGGFLRGSTRGPELRATNNGSPAWQGPGLSLTTNRNVAQRYATERGAGEVYDLEVRGQIADEGDYWSAFNGAYQRRLAANDPNPVETASLEAQRELRARGFVGYSRPHEDEVRIFPDDSGEIVDARLVTQPSQRPPTPPARQWGRASDGSVLPVRAPQPIRQSLVGGSDDLREAAGMRQPASEFDRLRGEGLDLYHGSRRPIEQFDRPLWATSNPRAASEYALDANGYRDAAPNVLPLRGQAQNPLRIDTQDDLIDALGGRQEARWLGIDSRDRGDMLWEHLDDPQVRAALQRRGYDAVYLSTDYSPLSEGGSGRHTSVLFLDPQRIQPRFAPRGNQRPDPHGEGVGADMSGGDWSRGFFRGVRDEDYALEPREGPLGLGIHITRNPEMASAYAMLPRVGEPQFGEGWRVGGNVMPLEVSGRIAPDAETMAVLERAPSGADAQRELRARGYAGAEYGGEVIMFGGDSVRPRFAPRGNQRPDPHSEGVGADMREPRLFERRRRQ